METKVIQYTKEKVVPKLRFREFESELQKKEFGKLAERSNAKYNPKIDANQYPCVELECLSQGTGSLLYTFDSREQQSIKNRFKKGEILFGKLRPYLKKYFKADFEGVCSSEIWVLKGKAITNEYLFQIIQTEKFEHEVNNTSGSKMPRAEWDYISQVKFHFPSLREQQKIASFLSAVDSKIQQLNRKKELLKTYKKGVMQQLFSREIRLKQEDGTEFPDWQKKRLGDLAERRTQKNTEKKLNIVLTNSATRGIISQNEYFDREVANQNNLQGYYIVSKDDFVYNPRISVHAPVGPIKRNKLKEGVMSPLYSVFRFKDENNLSYFEFFFETVGWHRYLNGVANFGARHDRMNISLSDFYKMPIPYPCSAERNKIANYLSSLDQKIEMVSQQIEKTTTFKKGLLQQMFV